MSKAHAFLTAKELAYYFALPNSAIRGACTALNIPGIEGRFTLAEATSMLEYLKSKHMYAPYFASRTTRMNTKGRWYTFLTEKTVPHGQGWVVPIATLQERNSFYNPDTDIEKALAAFHTQFKISRSTGIQEIADRKILAIALEPYGIHPKNMDALCAFYDNLPLPDTRQPAVLKCPLCGHLMPHADRSCVFCMLRPVLTV